MIYYEKGGEHLSLSRSDLKEGIITAFKKMGKKKKILIIPPDITRFHSRAGVLTELAWEYMGNALTDILPALGTHNPMTEKEIQKMYGKTPSDLFRVHDWRNDVVSCGEVPSWYVRDVSEGRVDFPWTAQVNRLLVEGRHDLILSIGQVVPHEVVGMANYNKNIFVGTGGAEGINKSHFLGAVYGMERMMGRADTPVRRILNYASDHFAADLPIVYILTVIGPDEKGVLKTRGLFIGDDETCFLKASELSAKVNITRLREPLKKVVVYLNPEEFRSTWLGNKAIYRTRMALADGGDLVILAPGLKEFGEDREIDHLIRKYGYRGTAKILELVGKNADLSANLSAAAHLIHGSSEGRFTITYCPGNLTREEITGVGFRYEPLDSMIEKYNPEKLREGWNTVKGGENIYYIANPALGLWAAGESLTKEI